MDEGRRRLHDEEESRVYRRRQKLRVQTEGEDVEKYNGNTYEGILHQLFMKQEKDTSISSRAEGIRLPRILLVTTPNNRKSKVHSSLLNLAQKQPPARRTPSTYRHIKTPRNVPISSSSNIHILNSNESMNNFSMLSPLPNIHQILFSSQSKQIAIRLQKLNPLLRRLSFLAVQQLVLTCRLVKFSPREIIMNKRITRSMHCYVVITGHVLLKNRKFRVKMMAGAGDTFQEAAVVQMNYDQHQERVDYAKCLNQEAVCMRISKSQWMMVRHRLKNEYGLQSDVKVFESTLRRSFYARMSQLGKHIYQLNL